MRDYSLRLIVRNNYLLMAIKDAGFKNLVEAARAAGVSYPVAAEFMSLKQTPILRNGKIRPSVQRLANTLNKHPLELFPEQHHERPLKKSSATFEASIEDVKAYLPSPVGTFDDYLIAQQASASIERAINTLTPREREILVKRYGLLGEDEHTHARLAIEQGVSTTRISQIENKALRKLRHRRITDDMLNAGVGEAYGVIGPPNPPPPKRVPAISAAHKRRMTELMTELSRTA